MEIRQTLPIVLGALVVATAWRLVQPIPGKDAQTAASGQLQPAPPAPPAARAEKVKLLRLASLDAPPPRSTTGRDPWRFVEPPRHALSKKPEPAAALSMRRSASPPPQTALNLPQLSLDYLGNFGPSDQRIAVFTDGRRILNAREGEILGGNFFLARIGHESVELRLVGFPDQPARKLGIHRRPPGEAERR